MVESAIHEVDTKVEGVREDVADVCRAVENLSRKLDHFADSKEDKTVVDRRIRQVEQTAKDAAAALEKSTDDKTAALEAKTKDHDRLLWGIVIAVAGWALVNLFGLIAALGWLVFSPHLGT